MTDAGRRERDGIGGRRARWGVVSALALGVLVGVTACDRSPTEAEHAAPAQAQVMDRATGALLAETQGSGATLRWEGTVPDIPAGSEVALTVVFLDAQGRSIPYGGEYSLRARFPSGAPQNVLSFSEHGDHLDVEGLAPGETSLVLMLYHGNHSDWDSPPLPLRVVVGDIR